MTNFPSSRYDHVDSVLSEWKRERPQLNESSTALLSRLGRLNLAVGRELEALLARFNLTRAEYDVLATLRRKGYPFKQPLKTLLPSLMRSSGTVTFRLDRLEKKGFVRREADPVDRRSIFIVLTESGESLFNRVQPLHLADGSKLLSSLSEEEHAQFVALLKKMLLLAECQQLKGLNECDIALMQHYGFHLATKQSASDSEGACVQHVAPESPADVAGLRQGDLIFRINEKPVVPSDLSAEELLSVIRASSSLLLEVRRNGKPLKFTLASHPG